VKRRAAVSIAELMADGVPVHPTEAVALVRRLCASANDLPPRVSHPTEIVLLADGELLTNTVRERRLPAAAVLATLLGELLDHAPLGHRASAALSHVVARYLEVLTPAAAPSVRSLADALGPFEGADPKDDLRALFTRWRAVCDLGSDLPEASQTTPLVLLDATGNTRRSVIVRKPDRRRYERVALARAAAVEAVIRISATKPASRSVVFSVGAAEIRGALRRAQVSFSQRPRRGARDLAIASALVLTVVPTAWWMASPAPVRTESSPTGPAVMVAHAALRELAPSTLPDALLPGRPELISVREADFGLGEPTTTPVSMVDAPVAAMLDHGLNRASTRAPVAADFVRATRLAPKASMRRVRRSVPSAFWFPDGKRIGYNRGKTLEIVEVKNGRTRSFSTPRHSQIGMVAVSPDSRRLVFNAGREGAWLLDLSKDDLKQMRQLIADPSVRSFVWSPDGKRVAYYSRQKRNWQVVQR
jgi:hypothetical protein